MMYVFIDKINNEAATFTNGTDLWHFLGGWKYAMTEQGHEDLAEKYSIYTVPATNLSYDSWYNMLIK